MQPNRSAGPALVLLLVLAIGALVAWQLLGNSAPSAPPAAANTDTSTKAPAEQVEPATAGEAGAAATDAPAVRDAVAVDAAKSSLPSIVGQVVGPDQRAIVDAEVLCVPGSAFTPDFENQDTGDNNPFDPQAMAERMRGMLRDRVSVRSDAEGRFRVRVEGTSSTVSVRILARGHLLLDKTVPRPKDHDTDLGVLTLQAGAVIAGRVMDAAGNAIVGARVSRQLDFENNLPAGMDFMFPGMEPLDELRVGDSSLTDAAGRFELAHVEPGEFSLRARHPDHPTATRAGLTVQQGQSLTDILMTMARGAEIRGTVLDIPAGIAGLRVMGATKPKATNDPTGGLMGMLGDASEMLGDIGFAFSERQCDIGKDGSFVLRGLDPDNTYRVWVGQEGRGFAGSGVSSKPVEAVADSVGVELRYEPGVTVTFVVVDADTGKPIERMWVRDLLRGGGGIGDMMAMAPSTAREKSYPDGKVTVANLRPKPEQKLRLTIDAIGHAQLQQDDIELPEVGNLDLGTLRLEPRPVLQVTVITGQSSQPVSNARVRLERQQQRRGRNPFGDLGRGSSPSSGQTDSAGQCTLNALDGEAGRLSVTRNGYAPASVEVPAADGKATALVVRMVVGGSTEVTVLDPDQKPLENANVEHRTPDGNNDRRRTDANGLARFDNLAPGSHGFRIAADRGAMGFAAQFGRRGGANEAEDTWQSVEVADLEHTTLTLEKSPTSTLTGIVRENGVPLAAASVSLREGVPTEGTEAVAEDAMNAMMNRMGGGGRRQAKSGDDGAYELKELPSGTHSLRITHPDRAMPSTVTVTLRDGENRFDVDLEMTTLRGMVFDPLGSPVEGAQVSVSPKREGGDAQGQQIGRMMRGMMPGMGIGGSTQTTDQNGAFELRGVAAGVPLMVHATKKGLAPSTVEATATAGQTTGGIEVRLGAAGRIEVTVAKGGMFAAAQAKFVGPDAESVEPVMQVLRRGKGTLEGLRAGTWEVTYQGMNQNGEQAPTRTVEVLAGQTATVEF